MSNYTAKNIQYLESIEHIRKRPSMYIGDININGLHHLLYELLDNSLDEYLEGYCNKIIIYINKNDTITIEDNGRGIPIDYHKKIKKTALELVLTKIGAGGKFDKSSYKISSGLHGVGLSCVNALSKLLIVTIYRNNYIYKQIYSKGKALTKLKILGKTKKTGTRIKYTIDDNIFNYKKYNYNIIYNKLKEISFLNKGLKIFFYDKRIKIRKKIISKNGLKDYIDYIDKEGKNNLIINKDIIIKKTYKNIKIELIIRYKNNIKETIISYVNNVKTIDGGTHITGFKRGLTKSFKKYIYIYFNKKNKFINKDKIKGKDIREGLISIITIKLSNPEFEGQTKTKLVNKNLTGLIEKVISTEINNYLEENPNNRKKLLDKIILSYKSRYAAIRAKEFVLNKNIKTYNKIGGIPGKLSDCSYDIPNKCEIFLVEGDSAGGTAKQGRDRKYQAILPLKGKILNVEKSIASKILNNDEIKNIFLALGVYLEKRKKKIELNIEKLKYKKIIIMTDADVDGKHISSLILTFFYRYMKKLIEKGYIYVAKPPLYMIKYKNKKIYIWKEVDKNKYINNKNNKIKIQRYKGLGEMNADQLWTTTMNPKTRKLKKIYIKNNDKSKIIFNILMGENVKPRKEFIIKNAKFANIDI
ncbi:MAG: DNA gyrase subunit B [Candidatus Shikimatogenerans bostrichidophilus]|nr:MAG: DNA gyrase subunit B [Candidatus Shikimatogenerans bostrichidophilus]